VCCRVANRGAEGGFLAARFPAFDLRWSVRIRVWQTRKNGEGPEVETFAIRPPPQIAEPMALLNSFRFEDDESALDSPTGWPEMEAVVIGLFQYYHVELDEDHVAGIWRSDYECDGGAVLDLPDAANPFKEVEAEWKAY
jgi:hypothetical protein